MFELQYKKSSNGWPIRAVAENLDFVFSGTLETNRVRKENLHKNLELIEKIILWLLTFLGMVGLVLSSALGWQTKNPFFFLTPGIYNLIFWIACFTTTYLWAKKRQKFLHN